MKFNTFLLHLLLLSAITTLSYAQQSCQATLGSVNRSTPQFGFNTNGHVPPNIPPGYSGANWTQQWFIDSTIYLYPEILRFPGGTNTNHWDWKTGWFIPSYQPPGPQLTIRSNEFKPGLLGCNGEGLFVVNLETSTVQYEMDGLRHADSLGLNPVLFELGNEHNLDGDTTYPLQLMTPGYYSQLAKEYFDSIKAEFPAARICAVGGNTPGGNGSKWNDTVLFYMPQIDALAFHVYLTANNADLAFNVNRALAIPFGSSTSNTSLAFRYNTAGFGSLQAGKEVWVTEFNLEETQISSVPVIAKTWTHLLYITAMNHFFLSKSNVTMILNHSLASSAPHYESISKQDKHITANALAMKLLYDVARGSQTCQSMNFSGNPSIPYGTATIPKLVGWKFNHTGVEKGFICNFSKDTFLLSLDSVFGQQMQFDQYYADTASVISGLASANKYSGNSADSILIYPFSITQVSSPLLSSIYVQQKTTDALWIYPIPAQGVIKIQTNQNIDDAEIFIYNMAGQQVKSIRNASGQQAEISTSGMGAGTYLITIKGNNQFISGRFIID